TKNQTTIEYYLEKDDEVQVAVYNYNHIMIKEFKQEGMNLKGLHRFKWDGRDRNGRPVVSGVYLCVIKIKNKKVINKIAVIN
ncbi:MAG: FlgD immunoglobulin-like domain containing protein, partial [bacterium]|nr:FlgD immunoglobulin-like domain containing protein [bacterium]